MCVCRTTLDETRRDNRKSDGRPAQLVYGVHLLMENRSGLIADARACLAGDRRAARTERNRSINGRRPTEGTPGRLTDCLDHQALNIERFSIYEQLFTPIMTKVHAPPAALDAHLRPASLADVYSTRFAKAYGFHHFDH